MHSPLQLAAERTRSSLTSLSGPPDRPLLAVRRRAWIGPSPEGLCRRRPYEQPSASVAWSRQSRVLAYLPHSLVRRSHSSDPQAAVWKLNIAKSKYSPGPAPKSGNTRIEAAGAAR